MFYTRLMAAGRGEEREEREGGEGGEGGRRKGVHYDQTIPTVMPLIIVRMAVFARR